jgi:hypothetical protein
VRIEVPAAPASIAIDTRTAAVLVVDMQNDFGARDAMFRDYACVLLADCSAEPIGAELTRTNHDASLLVIEAVFGCVTSSTALLGALGAGGRPARRSAPRLRSHRVPRPVGGNVGHGQPADGILPLGVGR